MPHCIIEYSAPLADTVNIDEIVEQIFQATLESGLFKEKDIKCRAIPYTHFKIGEQQEVFVCTTIKLVAGRTPEQKQELANAIFNEKRALLKNIQCLTVEIIDLSDVYLK